MTKKIYFAGCSITAGNELWEEKNIPNYKSMTFKEARKAIEGISDKKAIEAYNLENAFPAIVGRNLGVETFNMGISGISNKEMAIRVLTYFKEDRYDDTIVVMQLTTHNRMLLKYKEDNDTQTFGSFVVMAEADDNRLTRRQNNILKEMFFEFLPESAMVMDDHIFFYYVVESLKNKGITVKILWSDIEIIDWANWDITHGDGNGNKFKLVNDRDPQWIEDLSRHFTNQHHQYNLLGTTLKNIVGKDGQLPRLHFSQESHNKIAEIITEKLKCLIG